MLLFLAAPATLAQTPAVSPAPGDVVVELRPVITVRLPPGGPMDPATARLWVNGSEVTALCLRTPLLLSYRPPAAISSGPVQLRFQARARNGVKLERSWSFTLQARQRIRQVTHDASATLGEYDTLKVEMRGEAGGRAWFEIPGLVEKVPMDEVENGLYRGVYQVQPGDYRMGARVVAFLRLGPEVYRRSVDPPVNLFGHLFRVTIFEPENGSQVPLRFDIRGRTRPGSRVVVVPRLGFGEGTAAPDTRDSESAAGSFQGQADERGFFTIAYGVPLKLPDLHVALTIFAVDPEGNRSAPTTLHLAFR